MCFKVIISTALLRIVGSPCVYACGKRKMVSVTGLPMHTVYSYSMIDCGFPVAPM